MPAEQTLEGLGRRVGLLGATSSCALGFRVFGRRHKHLKGLLHVTLVDGGDDRLIPALLVRQLGWSGSTHCCLPEVRPVSLVPPVEAVVANRRPLEQEELGPASFSLLGDALVQGDPSGLRNSPAGPWEPSSCAITIWSECDRDCLPQTPRSIVVTAQQGATLIASWEIIIRRLGSL